MCSKVTLTIFVIMKCHNSHKHGQTLLTKDVRKCDEDQNLELLELKWQVYLDADLGDLFC